MWRVWCISTTCRLYLTQSNNKSVAIRQRVTGFSKVLSCQVSDKEEEFVQKKKKD